MLTIYNKQSGFKKKFTVVAIWLIAAVMFYGLIQFLRETELSWRIITLPAIIGFVVIAAILLRCKVGRAFTLTAVYIMILAPFLATVLIDGAVLNLTQAIYSVFFGLLAIYVFSNEKAMDLYYIESNPKEHIFYVLAALFLTVAYLKLV